MPNGNITAKIICFCLFIFLNFQGFSQDTLEMYAILELTARQMKTDQMIYYADRVNTGDIDRIKKALRSEDLFDVNDKRVELTENEKKFLLSELDKCKKNVWTQNFFDNSRMFPLDSLKKGKPDHCYSAFTRPIFFRDDEACLFYHMYTCGTTSGYDAALIYRWQRSGWAKWIKLTGGKM